MVIVIYRQKIGSVSALSIIELIVEAKRLGREAFDVCVIFDVKTEIKTLKWTECEQQHHFQAHELTDVMYVR